eukprot:2040069-Amphidinium_carterae.1
MKVPKCRCRNRDGHVGAETGWSLGPFMCKTMYSVTKQSVVADLAWKLSASVTPPQQRRRHLWRAVLHCLAPHLF